MSPEQVAEVNSNFLIDSWNYSKVTQFARNEKAFEMVHIYGERTKQAASSVAGNAYHYALQVFFQEYKDTDKALDLPTLEILAYNYIDEVPANAWKIQKTTPTIEDCKTKSIKVANLLLKNFASEFESVYLSECRRIVDVEMYVDEYLVINGVEIPIPCHALIDLVIETTDGKTVIIDHKSKQSYTSDEEMAMSIGIQAITYVNCYEEKTGIKIDEVWFVENKYSQNKDGSAQLAPMKVQMSENTRKLYEALLYEPLKRMIEAVNNPDYVYLINDSDNFVDRAELYDFWAKTMICEVEDFNVPEAKREMIARRFKKIRDTSLSIINPKVIREFKDNASKFIQYDLSSKDMTHEQKIEHVLRSFGTVVQVSHKLEGYSFDTYLLEFSAGTKIGSVQKNKLDIANALNVPDVRIGNILTVYEGRSYLGIEVEKKREKDLIWSKDDLKDMCIPIGKDNLGNVIYWDLNQNSTPHILMCGATGSGKSVCLESIVEYALESGINDVIILDPKNEFSKYKSKLRVIKEIEEIEECLASLVDEMNKRIDYAFRKTTMVIFDEFAEAFMLSRKGNALKLYENVCVGNYANGAPKYKRECVGEIKSLQENLMSLAQKGRSSGFRICIATQRASTEIIKGDIKVNFPVQICFAVPKAVDSKVVLDETGAEILTGRGDGLIKSPLLPNVTRFQSYYKPN